MHDKVAKFIQSKQGVALIFVNAIVLVLIGFNSLNKNIEAKSVLKICCSLFIIVLGITSLIRSFYNARQLLKK